MPKSVKCKNCNNLVNHWCEKVIDSPDEDMERDCQYFWQRTNGDRIRAMSDEEMAEFICSKLHGCFMTTCPGEKLCNSTDGKANGLKKWLQQPVEVDNG